MTKLPRTPHDGLFKLLTDHPEAVAALVRDHLPAEIAKRVVAVRHADNRLLDGLQLSVTQSGCPPRGAYGDLCAHVQKG